MVEELKQINATRVEHCQDFKQELLKRLKNDERTTIYFNFICLVDEIALDIINEIERGF